MSGSLRVAFYIVFFVFVWRDANKQEENDRKRTHTRNENEICNWQNCVRFHAFDLCDCGQQATTLPSAANLSRPSIESAPRP